MRYLVTFLLIISLIRVNGQVVVTNSGFPKLGDTMYIAVDGMPEGLDLRPGTNRKWDFSHLQGLTRIFKFQAAALGTYAGKFPQASMLLSSGSSEEHYFTVDKKTFNLSGHIDRLAGLLTKPGIATYEPAIIERRAPLYYEDSYNQEATHYLSFSSNDLIESIREKLPFTADSLRFRVAIERDADVDAWGELKIPEGRYDVLREHIYEYLNTGIEIKNGRGQWKDVTAMAMEKKPAVLFDYLGKSKKEFYRYLSEELSTPIAKVVIDTELERAVSVEFKSNGNVGRLQRYVNNGRTNIYAYPNPAIDEIRFEMVNLKAGTYELKLFNILGMEVLKKTYQVTSDKTVELNLSKLKKGTYLYSLVNERGKTITTKRLMIIRP